MEGPSKFMSVIAISMFVLALSVTQTNGQITTPCTASMISSFTPCMNFITGSTGNGASPTVQCCGSVRSLLSKSMDCACLILTASVPFQLPINRTLALSLPRACSVVGGVPIQCKASAAPLPAPGILPLSPAPSPSQDTSSPTASTIPVSTPPALAPKADTTGLTPPPESPTVEADAPVAIPGRRPVVTPNAAAPKASHISWTAILSILVVLAFKVY